MRTPLEAREAAPGAQEHLLRHLVGLACIQPKPTKRPVHPVGVEHDQFGERLLVAVAGPPNQLILGPRPAGHRLGLYRLLGGRHANVPPPKADLP